MAGEWYKEFYLASPMGEDELRKAIADPQNLSDVRKRYEEMKGVPEGRCHITKGQLRFLERVLADFPD
jgi:hypothetical protein